jgi:hypothetical protein
MPYINLLTSSFLPLLVCFASPYLTFLSGFSQLYRFSDLDENEVEKKHGLLYSETVRALEPVAREVTMTSVSRLLQAVTREKVRL